jgi:hypothetical protein
MDYIVKQAPILSDAQQAEVADQSPQHPPRPIPPTVKVDGIPDELKAAQRWVCWRYDYRTNANGERKWTKQPLNPKTLRNAKSDDPSTWGSFDEALYKWKVLRHEARVDGVGFMLGDRWAGIDIDNCLDADQKFIIDAIDTPEVIKNLDTYTEISPSGRGVKMLFHADTGKGRKKDGWECYSQVRFFTITGHHLPGTPTAPQPRQQQADEFLATYFGDDDPEPVVNHSNFMPQPITEERLKDAYERACQRPYGERFRLLCRGEWQGLENPSYPSPSEADCALLNYMAYELGRDPDAIDRLFRKSGLMRPKWDERRGASTYGRQSIDKVLSKLKNWHEGKAQVSIEYAGNELLTDDCKTSPTHPTEQDATKSPLPVVNVESLRTDDRTAYLWQGYHALEHNVTEAERIKQATLLRQAFDLLPPTGLLPEFLAAYSPTTDSAPLFGLASALALGASVLNRNVWYESGGRMTYPMLWLALVAGSGERKSTWLKYLSQTLRNDADLWRIVMPSDATWAAVAKHLGYAVELNEAGELDWNKASAMVKDKPRKGSKGIGVFILDEIGGFLAQLNQAHNAGYKETLTSIFEGMPEIKKTTSSSGSYYIPNPYLSIVGASTSEWLRMHLHRDEGGFIGRWLFCLADPPAYRLTLPDDPNQKALDRVSVEIARMKKLTGAYTLDDIASKRYCEWAKQVTLPDGMGFFMSRMLNLPTKLGVILQASVDSQPVISVDTLDRAIRLTDYLMAKLAREFDEMFTETKVHADLNRLRSIIRGAGVIDHSPALKKMKGTDAREFARLLETLQGTGEVERCEESTGGRKVKRYKWVA